MLFRHGWYCGYAARVLGDDTYGRRWLGRAHELTEAEYLATIAEINGRLLAAGSIAPDEDVFLAEHSRA
jgi:hypothetical protein